ncbi:MAG: hypothetical protein MR270_01455 [Erysipelotrichaceae bacterium]|nr:hypothetical protein [Erysipelotrichaceae bacterium]
MKREKVSYKILSTVILLFIVALSLVFGFFIATSRTEGNVAYWVFKAIVVAWLVFDIIFLWCPKTTFSKLFPNVIFATISQAIPAFMRIGWTGEDKLVPPTLIIVFAIILMMIIAFSSLMSISHGRFKRAEDRVPTSSNKID